MICKIDEMTVLATLFPIILRYELVNLSELNKRLAEGKGRALLIA
jgi:hypothetical protein